MFYTSSDEAAEAEDSFSFSSDESNEEKRENKKTLKLQSSLKKRRSSTIFNKRHTMDNFVS